MCTEAQPDRARLRQHVIKSIYNYYWKWLAGNIVCVIAKHVGNTRALLSDVGNIDAHRRRHARHVVGGSRVVC